MNRAGTTRAVESIPPELLRSTPRPVALSAAGKLVVAIAILCCAGIVADLVGTLGQVRLRNAAREEGVLTNAEITRVTQTHGKNAHQEIRYRYQALGQWHEGRASLAGRGRPGLSAGQEFQIEFLPSSPEVSWMAGHMPGMPLWFVPIVPAVLIIVVVLLVRELRRQASLLSSGRAALGRVTESRRVYRHDHRAYRVEYQFSILSGATRTGHHDLNKKPPAVGSPLIVLYDPDEPCHSARYPLSLVRVES